MQAVLSPIVGRLSDVLDRKYLASIPPLIAFIGAIVSAKAQSMPVLIAGGILIGTTLSTISIVQAIPAEVLPLKYRAVANGFSYMGGSIGALVGVLGAGGVTNTKADGWRDIYWIQVGLHLCTAVSLFVFYTPVRRSDYPCMKWREIVWAVDLLGSGMFAASATLLLLAFDWAAGVYPWSDPHVAVPLALGLALMVGFGVYEWKGRADGLVSHAFFRGGPNFALSVGAFVVEGWLFYGAVNSVVPQTALQLGFAENSWKISIRQLSYNLVTLVVPIPIIWYCTHYKDLKWPLVVCFAVFLIASICYATLTPSMNHAQLGYNVLSGIGQSGPLTLIVALVQFTAPHEYLATATGLAFSARAIGGALGSAVLDAIINGRLNATYESKVSEAALGAGLPSSSSPALFQALKAGSPDALSQVPGIDGRITGEVLNASHWAYARAYNIAWATIVPFVVLALVCMLLLKGVKELMTEKIEATVEKTEVQADGKEYAKVSEKERPAER